jgi:hypothetical protein
VGHFELLKILTLHSVPVVVIGAHAVSFHGHIRNTEDLDVIWLRTPESEASLLRALRSINANSLADEIDRSTGLEKLVSEADVQQVLDESIPAGGTQYVSLNWLKLMKGASDRSKDAEDLKHLEE